MSRLGYRIFDLQHVVYDRTRHPDARRRAHESGTERDFAALRGHKHCLLVSFRRDGQPVPTQVWFALEGDRKLYFRTVSNTLKLRRIARDPHVRVAPCNVRGRPLGPFAEGRARRLEGTEAEHARDRLRRSWSVDQRIFEGAGERTGVEHVYLEVTPA